MSKADRSFQKQSGIEVVTLFRGCYQRLVCDDGSDFGMVAFGDVICHLSLYVCCFIVFIYLIIDLMESVLINSFVVVFDMIYILRFVMNNLRVWFSEFRI